LAVSQGKSKDKLPKIMREFVAASIGSRNFSLKGFKVFEYTIPGVNGEDIGFIRHFKSTSFINGVPDGPDDLFQELQIHDLGLKRGVAKNKGGKFVDHTILVEY
jgi:hypothetical protein